MSFVNFSDIAISEKIRKLLSSKDQKDLEIAKDFSFRFRDYVIFMHNLLDMSVTAGTEAEDLLVIRDLIQFAFAEVQTLRNSLSMMYQIGFILPFIIQLVFGHYSNQVVFVCAILCLVTQSFITLSEIRSMISRP